MVDLERQQRRVHRQHRQQRQRRQSRSLLRHFTSAKRSTQHSTRNINDSSAQTGLENVTVTPSSHHLYHSEPLSGISESKSSDHRQEDTHMHIERDIHIDPELQYEAPQIDPVDPLTQEPNHESPQNSLSEHSDSDNSGVLFGRIQREYPTEEGLFGLRDGTSVSKYEFDLSVLLYLGKIQYENDVYVWSKVTIHMCDVLLYALHIRNLYSLRFALSDRVHSAW